MTVSIKNTAANFISSNPIAYKGGKCVEKEVADTCGIGFENTVAMISGIRGAFYKEESEKFELPLEDFTSLKNWDLDISAFQVDFYGMDIDSYGGGIYFSNKGGTWNIYARVAGPRIKDRGELYKAFKPSENGNRIFELKIQEIPVEMGDFILAALRDGRQLQIQTWKPGNTMFLGKAYCDPSGVNRIEGTPSTYVLAFVEQTHPEYVRLGEDKSVEFGMDKVHLLYKKMSEKKSDPFEGLAETPASKFYREVMGKDSSCVPLKPQPKVEEVKEEKTKEIESKDFDPLEALLSMPELEEKTISISMEA